MKLKTTLFIVGAGASCDFGFPVGTGLVDRITKIASGEVTDRSGNTFARLMGAKYKGDAAAIHARREAIDGIRQRVHSAKSIDRFIDRERGNPLIAEMGKVMIAQAIASYEATSDLARGQNSAWGGIRSWCEEFLRLILDDAYADALDDIGANVAVICFNYDRCLEQYLAYGLSNALTIDLHKAWQIVQQIEIIHPYGTLGDLPYGPGGGGVPFGAIGMHTLDVFDMGKSIRTFTEQQTDQAKSKRIKHLVAEAQRIFFLGFGYQRQNMEMLTVFGDAPYAGKKVYATGKLSRSDVDDASSRILHMLGAHKRPDLVSLHFPLGMDCVQTLNEYQLALSDYLS